MILSCSLSFLWKIPFIIYTSSDTHTWNRTVCATCFTCKASKLKGPIWLLVDNGDSCHRNWTQILQSEWWSEQITIPSEVSPASSPGVFMNSQKEAVPHYFITRAPPPPPPPRGKKKKANSPNVLKLFVVIPSGEILPSCYFKRSTIKRVQILMKILVFALIRKIIMIISAKSQ